MKLDFDVVATILQSGGVIFLASVAMKIFRKMKLFEIKLESLIYAIKTESNNGFGRAYQKKLEELLEELSYLK